MRKVIMILMICCAAAVFVTSPASYAADKVGYINLQRLVNESEMGKAAKNDLQKLRSERETLLRDKLKELNDLRDLINKESATMDTAEKNDKVQEFNRAYKDYQRILEDAKEDISNEDKELVAIILEKADGVLKEVAKKKKYSIILKDANAIGYLDPEVDITDDVLKELNK